MIVTLYTHCTEQLFKYNAEDSQLVYQYYQCVWNCCLAQSSLATRFQEENHLKMTTINFIHQFCQYSL